MNHLSKESSPYLLQHKDNPVHWYAWSDDAFKAAKEQNKAIFLSIGYSTCHWCHVMEHESFENPDIAKLMNDAFINIKVDREERPDIDQLYMSVCQMMTGAGGWPLTIVMTPDKEPFFAGTYFPAKSLPQRIGMQDLIPSLLSAWNDKPESVFNQCQKIMKALELSNQETHEIVDKNIVNKAIKQCETQFDRDYGGFTEAPKFPSSHQLNFLLSYYKQSGDKSVLDMVTKTLDEMFSGGIYDQVGYGFHRYSTDKEWHLPHFEKMLYDQAQLIMTYSLAYDITQKESYKRCVEQCIEYALERMNHSEGAFFQLEDADSEGEEGTFYIWKQSELKSILSEKELEQVTEIFNISEEGNFVDEARRVTIGENILNPKTPLSEMSNWNDIRLRLKEEREKRESPGLDDKVLTDWNALWIAGLAKARVILNNNTYIELAQKTLEFIESYLEQDKKLLHRFKDGNSGIEGTLFDYQFYVYALIILYEVTDNERYLEKALTFHDISIELFWDEKDKGYFISQSSDLIIKQKDSYDGAIPSGNAIAYFNDCTLSRITHDAQRYLRAQQNIQRVGQSMNRYPLGYTCWLDSYVQTSLFTHTLVVTESLTKEQRQSLKMFKHVFVQEMTAPFITNILSKKGFKSIDNKKTFLFVFLSLNAIHLL